MTDPMLKAQFELVVQRLATLQQYDRYEGCFIFGSYVTGEIYEQSDLDVVILVADAVSCPEVSHPRLNGIPLDISFNAFDSIERSIHKTLAQSSRPKPWLYETYRILFDKRGRLQELADWVQQNAKPAVYTVADYDDMQLTCYYALTKARKALATQPDVALLVMQTDLHDLLRRYYKIAGRWRVSNKKLLHDLQSWDPAMHKLLQSFLTSTSVTQKFVCWEEMIDRVLAPIGGRNFAKYTGICSCEQCQADIQCLFEAQPTR